MYLNPKTRQSKIQIIAKYSLKIFLPIIAILVIILFVGRLDLPAPNKLIKQEISNDKLIVIK